MIVDLMRNDLTRASRGRQRRGARAVPVEPIRRPSDGVDGHADLAGDSRCDRRARGALPLRLDHRRAQDARDGSHRRGRGARRAGIYTGAIGRLDANGDAMFNVAIRTLSMIRGTRAFSGWDRAWSPIRPRAEEWHECLAKGAFVTPASAPFDLIETMRFDPEQGIPLLERHLARMKASAKLFGFAVRSPRRCATSSRPRPSACAMPAVRLLLARSARSRSASRPCPLRPKPVAVAIRAAAKSRRTTFASPQDQPPRLLRRARGGAPSK
jgi:para-aminobenzoate synthetase/4-amino-4-deoxychorismate lyase